MPRSLDRRNRPLTIDEAATRAALERIAADGSDLRRPLTIDFFVAVPDRHSGESVARDARARGSGTAVEYDEPSARWTCYCTTTMVPELHAVVAVERELNEVARKHGGHADGFGTFGNFEAHS